MALISRIIHNSTSRKLTVMYKLMPFRSSVYLFRHHKPMTTNWFMGGRLEGRFGYKPHLSPWLLNASKIPTTNLQRTLFDIPLPRDSASVATFRL